jgi:hypothetical protein
VGRTIEVNDAGFAVIARQDTHVRPLFGGQEAWMPAIVSTRSGQPISSRRSSFTLLATLHQEEFTGGIGRTTAMASTPPTTSALHVILRIKRDHRAVSEATALSSRTALAAKSMG